MEAKKSKSLPTSSGEPSLITVRNTMKLLSGKWKMQIVSFLLKNGKTRFTELQRGVPGISPKILSKELQELQQSQIVSRTIMHPKLISVEYELTAQGKKLKSVINVITRWGTVHIEYLLHHRIL